MITNSIPIVYLLTELGKRGLVIPTLKHVDFVNPKTKILKVHV